MLLDAAVIAALAGLSVVYLSDRIPKKIRNFCLKHNITTDLMAFLVAYTFLGGTISAVVAGVALIGVAECISYIATNPDDFLYLWDLKRQVSEGLVSLKGQLKIFGQDYRAKVRIIDGGLSSNES